MEVLCLLPGPTLLPLVAWNAKRMCFKDFDEIAACLRISPRAVEVAIEELRSIHAIRIQIRRTGASFEASIAVRSWPRAEKRGWAYLAKVYGVTRPCLI